MTSKRIRLRRRHGQRGFAIVSVLMLTLLVVLTAGMVLTPSLMGRKASAYSGAGLNATNVSEAGIDYALAALNSTIPTGATSNLAPLPAVFVQGTGANANMWTYNDIGNGRLFRTTFGAVPTLTVRIPASVPIPGGTGVAADYRIIRSEATVTGAQKRIEVIAALQRNTVQAPINPFTRAITARGTIDPNGNNGTLRTDSYDSARGPYGGGNLGTNGGVHTNGSIVGGGVYRGNVSAVGTIDPGLSVQGAGNTVRPAADPEEIADPPPLPAITTNVTVNPPQIVTPSSGQVVNLGAVSISGNASKILVLNAGTYVMSSLSTTGNATIQIGTGPVTIYVTGNIDVKGNGIVNSSAQPPNLRMIATNPSASVSMAGNGNFYGVLQAPNNMVTLGGNGEFFGALVADNFSFNGSNSIVHYDDAVGRAFASMATQVRPADWRAHAINVLDRGNS